MPSTTQRRHQTPQSVTAPQNDMAGYLLRRAGFGATSVEVAAAIQNGLKQTTGELVDYEQAPDNFTPPPQSILNYDVKGNFYPDLNALTVWWLNRMLTASRPLQERMVLFWHGHFATAIQKVHSTQFMYQQNQIFRQNALGRFDDLLSAVYKDPAMLIWLDGYRNTKAAPNENWGREVMELFVLGHGHYSEDDVHASARAFTGWRLTSDGQATYIPRLHDDGPKTFLGQTGNWTGEDAVRILCAHPAAGSFLATRLWRFFASDQPPQSAINTLSGVYYHSDHSIREMVRTLLTMPEFYSAAAQTGHIKSPTEYLVLTLRQLGLTSVDLTSYPRTLALLGQQLFNPPNVGGWPAGATWIDAGTMLGRFNFASALTGDFPRRGPLAIDAPAMLNQAVNRLDLIRPPTGYQVADALIGTVAQTLGISLTPTTRAALRNYVGEASLDDPTLVAKVPGVIHLSLVSPEYQAS